MLLAIITAVTVQSEPVRPFAPAITRTAEWIHSAASTNIGGPFTNADYVWASNWVSGSVSAPLYRVEIPSGVRLFELTNFATNVAELDSTGNAVWRSSGFLRGQVRVIDDSGRENGCAFSLDMRTNTYSGLVKSFSGFLPDSLANGILTNFIARRGTKNNLIWENLYCWSAWPAGSPALKWNTNGIIYGMGGFTAISQHSTFAIGQVPWTALTKRHIYARGHDMGWPVSNGSQTIRSNYVGARVYFCTSNNVVIERTIACEIGRYGFITNAITDGMTYNGLPWRYHDYTIAILTEDLPQSITPIKVMTSWYGPSIGNTNLTVYPIDPYVGIAPRFSFNTEQAGHCAVKIYWGSWLASSGLMPDYLSLDYDDFKGGDSGSPNMLPAPNNDLIFYGGRTTSGPSALMQHDMDQLTERMGLNTNSYQLNYYDFTGWPTF